ncbi:hypothetical protein ACIA5D_36445 [Actinoplanes sp. NPDC051513]|uniref:hypothetical protein n=1 Tax=Actinoplanes sp. NPDC051513 TaxID=3363908 RepID=UPI00379720DF
MTATLPPHADVRDCRLYRFWVRHPESGERVLGYVGETVRQPMTRLLEHLLDQPWADTIIGWEIDDRVFAGKGAVLEAERFAIETELPLYNVEWNRGNPHRIPPPAAIRQRRARDATKADTPRWEHPADRVAVVSPAPTSRARSAARRRWRPWQKNLLALAIVGLVLWIASLVVLARTGLLHGGAWWQALVGCYSLTVWGWLGFPALDKRSSRRFRIARRRWRGR